MLVGPAAAVLMDCDTEIAEFLETTAILGLKLGPMVFQFPFFNWSIFRDRHEFLDRLLPFLNKLPVSASLQSKFAIVTGSTLNSQTCCAIKRLLWCCKIAPDAEPIRIEIRSDHGGLDLHPLVG